MHYSGIMSGGNKVESFFHRPFIKNPELYFFIAHHIGIGGSTRLVFGIEIIYDPRFILIAEIQSLERNVQRHRGLERICLVFIGSATVILYIPTLHEYTRHLITLFF